MSKSLFSRRKFLLGSLGASALTVLTKLFPEAYPPSVSANFTPDRETEKIRYFEITGESLDNLLSQIEPNDKFVRLTEYLERDGYEQSLISAVAVRSEAKPEEFARLVRIDYDMAGQGNHAGRLIATQNPRGDWHFALGLISVEKSGSRHMDVYEVLSEKIQLTSTWLVKPDGKVYQNVDGELTDLTQQLPVPYASDNCSDCIWICDGIYDLGCGLSSILVCTLVCAPVGNVLCPIICGVIYLALCVVSAGNIPCLEMCQDAGYC